jgi:hypothetical protein
MNKQSDNAEIKKSFRNIFKAGKILNSLIFYKNKLHISECDKRAIKMKKHYNIPNSITGYLTHDEICELNIKLMTYCGYSDLIRK